MSDLVERLRVKSAMIHLGEKIALGSECCLMEEAATALTAKDKEIEALRERVKEQSDEADKYCKWWREERTRAALAQPQNDAEAVKDFSKRCQAYLDDAPLDGRHSDAAGSNAYELIEEAIEHCKVLPAPPSPERMREALKHIECATRNDFLTANERLAAIRIVANEALRAGDNHISDE